MSENVRDAKNVSLETYGKQQLGNVTLVRLKQLLRVRHRPLKQRARILDRRHKVLQCKGVLGRFVQLGKVNRQELAVPKDVLCLAELGNPTRGGKQKNEVSSVAARVNMEVRTWAAMW